MAQHILPSSYEGSSFLQNDYGYLSQCFDGKYGERMGQYGYVCHTGVLSDPYISITLPGRYYVKTIKVWNRHQCCRGRYSNHTWTVDGVACVNSIDSTDDFAIDEKCGLNGTVVRLTLPGPKRIINLQEIEIWGWNIDEIQGNIYA